MDLGSFTAVGLLVSALYAGQNLLRYVKAKDVNGSIGILLAAALGTAVTVLAAHSDVTSSLVLIKGAPPIGLINGASQFLLGISLGSAGTVLTDFRKSFDNNSAADKPNIVG